MSAFATRNRRPLYLDLTAEPGGEPSGEQSSDAIAEGALQEVVSSAYRQSATWRNISCPTTVITIMTAIQLWVAWDTSQVRTSSAVHGSPGVGRR